LLLGWAFCGCLFGRIADPISEMLLVVASNLIPPREEEIAEAPGWKPQRRRR
jgi:hypothetical protein